MKTLKKIRENYGILDTIFLCAFCIFAILVHISIVYFGFIVYQSIPRLGFFIITITLISMLSMYFYINNNLIKRLNWKKKEPTDPFLLQTPTTIFLQCSSFKFFQSFNCLFLSLIISYWNSIIFLFLFSYY